MQISGCLGMQEAGIEHEERISEGHKGDLDTIMYLCYSQK